MKKSNGLSATIFIQSEEHIGIEWKHEKEQYKHDSEAHDNDANDLYRYKVVMMSALLKGLQNQAAFLRHKRLVRRLGEAEVILWVNNMFMLEGLGRLSYFFPGNVECWCQEKMIFETLRCSRRRSYCSRRRPLAHSVLKLGDFFSVMSFKIQLVPIFFIKDCWYFYLTYW